MNLSIYIYIYIYSLSACSKETGPATFTFQGMVDKETKQMLLQIDLDVSVVEGNFRSPLAKIIRRWRPPPGEVPGINVG